MENVRLKYINKFDVPLLRAEPLNVVFRSSRPAIAGFYDWTVGNSLAAATPRVDLDPANLYALEYFTFSADLNAADYSGNIVDTTAAADGVPGIPRLSLYVDSEGPRAPILTQPIPVAQYYQNAPFPKWRMFSAEVSDFGNTGLIAFQGIKGTNQFQAAFEARLNAILGKPTLTLIFSFGLLEIKDENFTKDYKSVGALDPKAAPYLKR